MMLSATVDLPQPDSPTSPRASPWPSAKLSPGMTVTSPARGKYEIRTSWNSRSGDRGGRGPGPPARRRPGRRARGGPPPAQSRRAISRRPTARRLKPITSEEMAAQGKSDMCGQTDIMP